MKGLGRNNLLKRVSAFILALLMVFTMMPVSTSVMKAEDGETSGDGSGTETNTNTSVTYTFNVYEMVAGEGEGAEDVRSSIGNATVKIYAADYDGTNVDATAIALGETSSEADDTLGKVAISLPNEYTTADVAKDLVYEVTYTKTTSGDGENAGTSTIYTPVRGTLGNTPETPIEVALKPAIGLAGKIYLGSEGATTVSSSYDVYLLNDKSEKVYETKSRTNGTYVFDDVEAGTYTIEVQAKDDYTWTSCKIAGVEFDATGLVGNKNFNLVEKTIVSMNFAEPTITVPYGTTHAKQEYNFVDYTSNDETVKYSSDNTNVVTVNEGTGVITTVGVGTANITAEIVDDDVKGSATYAVTVTGYSISGTVTDGTNPIGGETVSLVKGDETIATVITEDSGAYTFSGLISGDYVIKVTDSEKYKSYASSAITLDTYDSTGNEVTLVEKEEVHLDVSFGVSTIELLINKTLDSQEVDNPLSICQDGEELTKEELENYDLVYSIDSENVIKMDSEGTIRDIVGPGTATITVSITSDVYKVDTSNSDLQYTVKVWKFAFVDEVLTDTVEKTYGDAAFSTKAILKGAGDETKDVSVTYGSSVPTIAKLVYVDEYGNEVETLETATDIKVELVAADDNSVKISATYGDVTIFYYLKVNKITSMGDFVWSGYDQETDVDESGNIVVDYIYGGTTKDICVAPNDRVTVQYTSSDSAENIISIDESTGLIKSIKGVGDGITISASITDTTNYAVAPITYTINVKKGTQTGFNWNTTDLTSLKENEDYTVTENAETGKLEQIEVTYEKGLTFDLGAKNTSESDMEYSYEVEYPNDSTNTNVATVVDGKVTINGAGTATIKCTAIDSNGYYEDKTITYELVVHRAEQSIQWNEIDWINPDDLTIGFVNETITVEYQDGLEYDLGVSGQIMDDELTYGFYTLDLENNEKNYIATVDTNGVVTINKVGDVYVWYKSTNENKYFPFEMKYHLVVEHGKQPLVWNAEDLSNLSEIAGTEVSSLPETGGTIKVTYAENLSYQLDVEGENDDLKYAFEVSGNEDGIITLDENDNNKVTINKAGTVTITYKATGTINSEDTLENYEVKELSYTLVIKENPQNELTWDTTNVNTSKVDISQLSANKVSLTYDPGFTEFKIGVSGQIDDSKLTKAFTSSDTSVATVGDDGTIKIHKSGTATITYTSTDTSGCYTDKTLTYELTINKANQDGFVWNDNVADGSTITIIYDKDNMDRDAQVTATTPAESAGATYAITSGDAVTITDVTTGAIKVNKSGVVTVTASIPATTNYNEKTLTYKLVINKDDQTVHFDNTTPSFFNGGAFTQPELILDEEEGRDSATVKYSIVSDSNGVISAIDETTGVITFSLQPGTVVVKATRIADEKYNEASATYTLTVNEWNPLANGSASNYYTISGTKIDSTSAWYTTVDGSHPIRLTAKTGYQLYKGTTDPVASTQWSSYVDVSDIHDGTNNSIVYYIKETSTGYVSKQYVINNFCVDTVAPSAAIAVDEATIWEKILSIFTFDLAGQDTPELYITSGDATSGVKAVYYYISSGVVPMTKNGSLDAETLESVATWKKYSGTVDLLNENVTENVIYTKVIDNAGNVTYAHTNGLIFDGAEPVVTPTVVTKDSNGIYYGNVEINLDIVDAAPYSGIQQITYVVENGSTVTESGTLFTFQPAEVGNPKQSELISAWNSANYGKNVVVKAADNNSDNVKVTFTVTDNAGNTTETVVNLMIDITAPVVSVQYDNNNGDATFANGVYYNANRTATITVKERHFDENNVKLTIKNTDGVIPSLSGWTKTSNGTGNGDDTTYQATVVFAADGDYTFDFSCVDSASNASGAVNYGTSQAPTAFTIDKTAPSVSVSYNNNDALNENYYKADRTATIVIQEHNFDASRVNVMITATDDGQTVAVPSISGWSSSGDTHIATIIYSSDALYTFDIEYADKAGNTIADFAPQTFYVDKTTPSVSITEIVDLSANNAEKIGFVITATDTNFDVFTPVLTAVIQTENGFTTTELDVASISEITNGRVYTVDNLEADGIYSITCTVIDKAGNAYTEVNLQRADGSTYVESRAGEDTLIMFSVNRDGSVFDVDDNTMDILNRYYVQNVENDIVIYEVNTNELSTYSISLNGEELVEGTDYTITSTGGNGEWMRYTYTVNKSLFENEGEYVLVVSSTDGAENNAFSDVKNTNISFVVDRTAPVVTITGMESNRSYQTDRQTVTLMPTDDGGIIETLTVYTVDRDGNVEEELLNMSGDELRETLDANGGTVSFELTEGINQNVQIICSDGAYNAAGEANTFNQTYENITVSASAVALFFAGNTLLYIGGGVGVTAVVAGGGIFFFRRRKMPKAKN